MASQEGPGAGRVFEFWLSRWREGRHGWHEADGNPALRKHWPALPPGSRVLLPLCGKSVDLLWLARRGLDVTGVEFSPLAARAFFDDAGLAYETVQDGAFSWFRNPDAGIAIACGDYFGFAAEPFDALYDRAALGALPPGKRPEYARVTGALLKPAAFHLLITLEFDGSVAEGPPYPVFGKEVASYWPRLRRVETRDDTANGPRKFLEAGVRQMVEVAWAGPVKPGPEAPG